MSQNLFINSRGDERTKEKCSGEKGKVRTKVYFSFSQLKRSFTLKEALVY